MNIYLIRHGMTVPGEEGRYQGVLDEGLSEKGRAALLKAPLSPSRVYVSPAKRARETASVLFPEAEQICVPDLMEMNFGVFEGRTFKEMEQDAQYRAWVDGMCLGTCPGGESRAFYSERVCNAFMSVLCAERERQACLTRHPSEQDLFIVAHGGTQMAVLERWGVPSRDYYSWQRPCGCGWLLALRESLPEPAGQDKPSSAYGSMELIVLEEIRLTR